MRSSMIVVSALIAACATPSVRYSVLDVISEYHLQDGTDLSVELKLLPGGEFTLCESTYVGVPMSASAYGYWRIDGDAVALEGDRISWGGIERYREPLILRQWEGHIYLVPSSDIDWFDKHGPVNEFCWSREGAPLFADQPSNYRAG